MLKHRGFNRSRFLLNSFLFTLLGLLLPLHASSAQTAFTYSAVCRPAPIERSGALFVPASFLAHAAGVNVMPLSENTVRLAHFGKAIDFAIGYDRAQVINGESIQLADSPVVINGYPFVPLNTCSDLFGFTAALKSRATGFAVIEMTTAPAQVTSVRYSSGPANVRIVLEMDHACAFRWDPGQTVRLTIPGTSVETIPNPMVVGDSLVRDVSRSAVMEGGAPVTRWNIACDYAVPAHVFTLADPQRIVVDCPRASESTGGQPLAPGAKFKWMQRMTSSGPLSIYCAEIDLRSQSFEIIPALVPGGNGFGSDPVSAIAAREHALVAVNGGYFATGSGVTLGALMINGEWIRPPLNRRSCLCINRSGELFIENLGLNANVRFAGFDPLPVVEINTHSVARGLNLYTPAWGAPLPVQPVHWTALIMGGRVTAIQPLDAVPSGGIVVIAKGPIANQLASRVREGDPVEVTFETTPPTSNLLHVIGAGPRLLQGGGVFVSSEAELFTGRYFNMNTPSSRAPRSALGITRDGRLLILVIDGRQPEFSIGLTLAETALLLRELGAYEAINLDGGGSSTLVINGQVVNSPSDGRERKVTTALVIRDRSAFASKESASRN